jgi:hypothetical protein
MKQEHLITGLVVFGVLVYILNAKKSTLDSAVVNSNAKDKTKIKLLSISFNFLFFR